MQQAKAAVAGAEAEERNRLLYVALTRARDRLYVAGFEGSNAPPADCWYNLIRNGLGDSLREVTTADGGIVWRIASAQTAKPQADTGRAPASGGPAPLPAWAKASAPPEPLITVPLAPSRLAPLESDAEGERVERPVSRLAEPAILPPSALAEDARFLRGTLTHALLEHLPALPKRALGRRRESLHRQPRRATAGRRAQEHRCRDARRTARAGVRSAVRPRGPGGGRDRGRDPPPLRPRPGVAARRQDRPPGAGLGFDPDRRLQDQPAAAQGCRAKLREAYLLQLAAYRLAVSHIFSQQRVRAAILWTDGPRIMEIPADMLDAARAAALATRARPILDA